MRLKHLLGPLPSVGASSLLTALFTIGFILLCWYVYRRDRLALYSRLERLPLEEDCHD